ncbi:MAG: DUF721 domain-containing protein [Flavobacteriaceae bacterium]|nr:DUF721 domain-containing protein [Flavobacteriaceae bacterium]
MAKRNQETHSLSEALKAFIDDNHLQKGIDNAAIADVWKSEMGNGVAHYTKDIKLRNQTLYVYLDSSVLREELQYGKLKIIEMMNAHFKREVVKELKLL